MNNLAEYKNENKRINNDGYRIIGSSRYYLYNINHWAMRKFYKNISEALQNERPYDKVIEILSNKFAVVKIACTNGTYMQEHEIMGLGGNGIVYGYGKKSTIKNKIKHALSYPNIEPINICYNHSENGKPYHWLRKNMDNRKWKQTYRRLERLI